MIYVSISANVDTAACGHQNRAKTNTDIVTYAYHPSPRNQ